MSLASNSASELPSHLQSLVESKEYAYAVRTLAQFEIPDFRDWPQPHKGIFGGWFLAGFLQDGVALEFFSKLANDVACTTKGNVTLELIVNAHERFWVNGSIACYFYLQSPPLNRKKVSFGPSLQPFKLDTSSSTYDEDDQ